MYNGIGSGFLTKDEYANVKRDHESTHFPTDLNVFKDHKGFRLGEIHNFVGPKGGGKSTWSKTILIQLCLSEISTLLYISEEERTKYLKVVHEAALLTMKDQSVIENKLSYMTVLPELKNRGKFEIETFFESIRDLIEVTGSKVFILDNYTTSFLAYQHINRQPDIFARFKELAIELNIAVLIFLHTSKQADLRKMDGDSVKGHAASINMGSYNYIIRQTGTGIDTRNFIFTEKSRYHPKANKCLYEAKYNARVGLFESCELVAPEEFTLALNNKRSVF